MEHGNYVIAGVASDRLRVVAVALLDLQIARQMIARCVEDSDDTKHSELEEACWTAALIRFRRAFSEGRGVAWAHDSLIRSLGAEFSGAYAQFRMLADKFIAHPVGIGEDMAVTALVGPGPEEGQAIVYGATVRKSRVFSPGANLAKRFSALLDRLIPLVHKLEEDAHKDLLQELKSWSAADLTKGGMYESSIHFDNTSLMYRKSMKSYRLGAEST